MKRKNILKAKFLSGIPDTRIENVKEKFQDNISFSFQFFDNSQAVGQDFVNWEHEHLYKLLDKLKHYCNNSISYWANQRVGGGKNHILEVYKKFPARSDFTHPKFVPIDVDWARFRLEGDMRLIGFTVSTEICNLITIRPNVFYVVFLDAFHRFYKT